MGLFKSKDERRIERQMKVRRGLRQIERSIAQQGKFADEFVKQARHAKRIGDDGQYAFIRASLKKTAAVKRMLERQLLAMKSAMLIGQQAEASRQFAESMRLLANEIGKAYGEADLSRTQADWEKAVAQAETLEQRMDLFLDTMEQTATSEPTAAGSETVSDEEIDRMIEAEVLAEERKELAELDDLEAEISRELGEGRQKD